MMIALNSGVIAADYKLNSFTLTYDGTITQNQAGKVNIHTVLNGLRIAANVYTPDNYDASKHYPAIVVAVVIH